MKLIFGIVLFALAIAWAAYRFEPPDDNVPL